MGNNPDYDPKIYHRRSIRLSGYDYSDEGMYFITICCHSHKHRFGKIENDEMILNEFGKIADIQWGELINRFPNIELDEYKIMPNHMHGIIIIDKGARLNPTIGGKDNKHSIGDMVGAYKSLVSNDCLDIFKAHNELMGKLWQRNYFEHIIRNAQEYHSISEYI